MHRKFCWNKKEEGRRKEEERRKKKTEEGRDRGAEGGRKEKEKLSTAISMACNITYLVYIYILPSTWITEPLSLEGGSDLPIPKERVMIDLNQWS